MMEEATTNIAAGVAGIKSLKTELEDLVTVEVKRKTSLDYYNELEEEGKKKIATLEFEHKHLNDKSLSLMAQNHTADSVIAHYRQIRSSIDADLLGRQKQLEQKQLEYDEIAKKFLAPGERQKERYEHYHKSFSRDPEWRQLTTLAQKEDPLDEEIKKLEKMLKNEEKKIASFENHGEGLQNEWVRYDSQRKKLLELETSNQDRQNDLEKKENEINAVLRHQEEEQQQRTGNMQQQIVRNDDPKDFDDSDSNDSGLEKTLAESTNATYADAVNTSTFEVPNVIPNKPKTPSRNAMEINKTPARTSLNMNHTPSRDVFRTPARSTMDLNLRTPARSTLDLGRPSESRNVDLNTSMGTPNRGPAIHSTPSVMVGLEGLGVTNQVNRMILSTSNPPEQSPIPRQGLVSPRVTRTPQRPSDFTTAPVQSPIPRKDHAYGTPSRIPQGPSTYTSPPANSESRSETPQIRSPYFVPLQHQDAGSRTPKIIHYEGMEKPYSQEKERSGINSFGISPLDNVPSMVTDAVMSKNTNEGQNDAELDTTASLFATAGDTANFFSSDTGGGSNFGGFASQADNNFGNFGSAGDGFGKGFGGFGGFGF